MFEVSDCFLFKHVEVPNVETVFLLIHLCNRNVDGTVFYILVYQDPLLTYLLAFASTGVLIFYAVEMEISNQDMCSRRYCVVVEVTL